MERTYRITVTDEIKSSSPQSAVRVFLHRLQSDETEVLAREIGGKEHCVEVLSGQVADSLLNDLIRN